MPSISGPRSSAASISTVTPFVSGAAFSLLTWPPSAASSPPRLSRLVRRLRRGLRRGDDRPVAHRPESQEEREKADDDVDHRDRELHPDAEGEERRARDADVAERVDQQRLLGADPARGGGHECRHAHRRLHEDDVPDVLWDPEGAEKEPDGREAEEPV